MTFVFDIRKNKISKENLLNCKAEVLRFAENVYSEIRDISICLMTQDMDSVPICSKVTKYKIKDDKHEIDDLKFLFCPYPEFAKALQGV